MSLLAVREGRNATWAVVVVALATIGAPRGAWAQGQGGAQGAPATEARPKLTEAQKQEIRERNDRATRLYYLRKYQEAIAEWEAIYLISADPVMLYNIAQSYRQGDQPQLALQFYKNYLRNAPTAVNRADVEKKIAEMEKLVEERRGAGTQPPGGTTVPPAVTPPLVVPPPTPGASTTPPPAGPSWPSPSAPAPTPTAPPIAGVPSPTPVPEAGPTPDAGLQTAPAPEPESGVSSGRRITRAALIVSGGVLVASSFVLGAVARAKAGEVERAAMTRARAFDETLQQTERDGRRASNYAVFTGVLGVAAMGAGIYLWLTETPAATSVAGRTRVVPAVGPGYVGGLLRKTF